MIIIVLLIIKYFLMDCSPLDQFTGLARGCYLNCILNSSPVDELGNWCHPRLVGALGKYQAQQGGSMATL